MRQRGRDGLVGCRGMPNWGYIALMVGTAVGVCVFLGVKFGAMGAVVGALCCISIGFFSSLAVILARWSERAERLAAEKRSGR